MQLSCRARYAIRAMIDLAFNYGEEPIPVTIIAKKENISIKYLNQLMGLLKHGGLVRVVRGKNGGATLSRSPSEITLGDVIYLVEGDMSLIDCVREASLCNRAKECVSRSIWFDLSNLINNYLKSITLADILKKEKLL